MGWIEVIIAVIGAITGAVGGFVGAKVSLARNRREERSAEIEDAATVVESNKAERDMLVAQYDKVLELKKQVREELERQLGTEREENRRLESIIRDQNARIDRLEAQVRDLVSSALAAGACGAAPSCPTHIPIISLVEGSRS